MSVGSQLLGQFQFSSLAGNLNVRLPSATEAVMKLIDLSNLDPRRIIGSEAEIPQIDSRTLFMLFAVIIPVALVILVLLLFVPVLNLVIYVCASVGIVLILAWGVGSEGSGDKADISLLISGCTLAVIAAIIALTLYLLRLFNISQDERELTDVEKLRIDRRSLLRFHRVTVFRCLLISFIAALLGFILLGFINVAVDFSQFGPIVIALSVVAFVVAFINLILAIFHLSTRTRLALIVVTDFIESYGLSILLALLSASFVPAVSRSVSLYMCNNYECPAGTRFNPNAYRMAGDYTIDEKRYCDNCDFLDGRCTSGNQTDLCEQGSSWVVWSDPRVSCSSAGYPWFIAAASIVMITYIICVPLLFFIIIRYICTELLKVQLGEVSNTGNKKEDENENWRRRTTLVRPSASSLYEYYTIQARYFTLCFLFYKLLVTLCTVLVALYSTLWSMIAITLIHSVFGIIVVFMKPYVMRLYWYFSMVLVACNIGNMAFLFAVYFGGTPTSFVFTFFFFLVNPGIPTIVSIILFIMFYCRRKENRERWTGTTENDEDSSDVDSDIEDKKTWKKLCEADKDPNVILTRQLNKATQERYLTNFMMFLGIIFFVAFGVSLTGYKRDSLPDNRIASSPIYTSTTFTLGGYDSWYNMTMNCCCIQMTVPPRDYSVMERWLCRNGVTIERGRTLEGNNISGLAIRGLCQRTLSANYSTCAMDARNNRLELVCPEGFLRNMTDAGLIEDIATKYLF